MSSKEKNDKKTLAEAGINTQLAHLGADPRAYHGFVNPPVVRASTVLFPDYETMRDRNQKYLYGTYGTPTTDALCDTITALEGAAGTVLQPSGLAAFLGLHRRLDHVPELRRDQPHADAEDRREQGLGRRPLQLRPQPCDMAAGDMTDFVGDHADHLVRAVHLTQEPGEDEDVHAASDKGVQGLVVH